MAFTYEVSSKTVKIFLDGNVYLEQDTDPSVGGWDKFESKAAAESWAQAWITEHEAELAAKASKEASDAEFWAAEELRVLDTPSEPTE
jgi:hypothetical protein